jgi:hypothetical protein
LIKEFLICSEFKPMLSGYLIKESSICSEVQANVGWPFDYKSLNATHSKDFWFCNFGEKNGLKSPDFEKFFCLKLSYLNNRFQ